MDCLFCKIAEGKISSRIIFESDKVLGFYDIQPVAATHFVFIHKNHSKNINEMMASSPQDIVDIFMAIEKVSRENQLDLTGFRVVTNLGRDAGQTIFHTHFHLIGGERLGGLVSCQK